MGSRYFNEPQLDQLYPRLFSPAFGQLDPALLASWILKDRLPVSLQQHIKYSGERWLGNDDQAIHFLWSTSPADSGFDEEGGCVVTGGLILRRCWRLLVANDLNAMLWC